MFSKIAILATVSFALSGAATPGSGGEYTCNTGSIQCCNQVFKSGTAEYTKLEAIVGVAAQGANLVGGANCSPLTAVGLGNGASCTQQPVCCEDNKMNGLVVVGCTPANVSL